MYPTLVFSLASRLETLGRNKQSRISHLEWRIVEFFKNFSVACLRGYESAVVNGEKHDKNLLKMT
jgi:hypothetical protein